MSPSSTHHFNKIIIFVRSLDCLEIAKKNLMDLKGDSEPPWYHVARPNLPDYMSVTPNPNSVYCCTKADAPDACIDLGKGFAESPFLTPSCPANLNRQAIEKLFNKIDGSLQ